MEEQKNKTPAGVTDAPRSVRWLRGAIAVCIILLMGCTLLIFHFWSKGAEARMENKEIQARYDSLLQTVSGLPQNVPN